MKMIGRYKRELLKAYDKLKEPNVDLDIVRIFTGEAEIWREVEHCKTPEEFMKVISQYLDFRRKITTLDELAQLPKKTDIYQYGLATGCYNIIMPHHVKMLEEAKTWVEYLIVGINTDESIRAIKPNYMIIPEKERLEIISSLSSVDYVCLLNYPVEAFTALQGIADLWFKGGDYTRETVNQPELKKAEKLGFQLFFTERYEGTRTQTLIDKLHGIK